MTPSNGLLLEDGGAQDADKAHEGAHPEIDLAQPDDEHLRKRGTNQRNGACRSRSTPNRVNTPFCSTPLRMKTPNMASRGTSIVF